MARQQYEQYWKLTEAFTDINGKGFIGTLRTIVDFIDGSPTADYSEEKYKELQDKVRQSYPKSDASIRKSINQFVKLGFIGYQLKSYHEDAKNFLEAETDAQRQTIYSKIVYTSSSFNRSVTNDSNQREINFLINTLEQNGKLRKSDIISLMTLDDLSSIKEGYLDAKKLQKISVKAEQNGFIRRKYNQVHYLWNLLKHLDDLAIQKDILCYKKDVGVFFEPETMRPGQRDGYLQRIYKNQLKEESVKLLGEIKCMVEKLSYPGLIASHIKPFHKASDKEAFDPANGLLLSLNMDGLFDKGYISFNDDGGIILSGRLDDELKEYLNRFSLDNIFLSEDRKKYLHYHRMHCFK